MGAVDFEPVSQRPLRHGYASPKKQLSTKLTTELGMRWDRADDFEIVVGSKSRPWSAPAAMQGTLRPSPTAIAGSVTIRPQSSSASRRNRALGGQRAGSQPHQRDGAGAAKACEKLELSIRRNVGKAASDEAHLVLLRGDLVSLLCLAREPEQRKRVSDFFSVLRRTTKDPRHAKAAEMLALFDTGIDMLGQPPVKQTRCAQMAAKSTAWLSAHHGVHTVPHPRADELSVHLRGPPRGIRLPSRPHSRG